MEEIDFVVKQICNLLSVLKKPSIYLTGINFYGF